ncbi:MAG: hypothetical protein DCC67_03190 [Planctomycetota bacterium]|nr:MAG: hypothetical protein DCC67_03190 [Planctomycetota bacterium]
MNVGATTGPLAAAAGASLAQTAGAATERTAKDAASQQRVIDAHNKSERASGIGQTEEDQQSAERDADGRRLWEESRRKQPAGNEGDAPRQSKDPTGQAGNALDLTG